MFGGCHTTYRSLWNNYIQNDLLICKDERKCRKICKFDEISKENMLEIIKFSYENAIINNTGFSINDLSCHLLQNYGININKYLLKCILIEYNFMWSQKP